MLGHRPWNLGIAIVIVFFFDNDSVLAWAILVCNSDAFDNDSVYALGTVGH